MESAPGFPELVTALVALRLPRFVLEFWGWRAG